LSEERQCSTYLECCPPISVGERQPTPCLEKLRSKPTGELFAGELDALGPAVTRILGSADFSSVSVLHAINSDKVFGTHSLKPIKVASGESCIDADRFKNVPLRYVHALRQSATAKFVINALHVAMNDNTSVFLYFNGSALFFDAAGRTDLVRAPSPHHAA
jgi:hypothetical protein